MQQSLLQFFQQNYDISTRFTNLFLSGENLLNIQALLTKRLREKVNQPQLPPVQFSESILGALMAQAVQYRLSWVAEDTIAYANVVFVENMIESLVARYYETSFWKRWCHQGIPDPNNIPLPLMPERTDYTAETSNYLLSDPWGANKPMY